MKKLLLLPILFIALASFAQTKLTIQSPNEKCANVVSNPRKTAGGDQGFWAARLIVGSGAPVIIRSFLQFDLSSIPAGSFVNWARLNLFSIGQNFGPNTSLLRRITSPWDPTTVTWNTQPTTTKRGAVILPVSLSPMQDYKNINVTNLVQAMVDSPATSFGFALKLDTEQNGNTESNLIFFSPAYGKTHDDPKLVIEYTNPGIQRAVTAMSFDNLQPAEMTIYPNPCNGIFNYVIKSASSGMTLKVIDMFGRIVYSKRVSTSSLQTQVNLPSVSSGTYFVVLQDDKSGTLVSQQLQVN